MKDTVIRVSGYDLDGHPFTLRGEQLGFGYRTSAMQGKRLVIC